MKNQVIANTFDNYFGSDVENFKISPLFSFDHNGEMHSKNVKTIIENFNNHPSFKNYQKTFQKPHHFHF